jgi:hypothetical protein
MDQQLKEYRETLIAAEQQAQQQYDKAILTLSGGAFGISFAFIDKVVGSAPASVSWLLVAWVAWGASITVALLSFYSSTLALRRAIEQVNAESVYEDTPGGRFARATKLLNATGGALFFVGVVSLIIFVSKNL